MAPPETDEQRNSYDDKELFLLVNPRLEILYGSARDSFLKGFLKGVNRG